MVPFHASSFRMGSRAVLWEALIFLDKLVPEVRIELTTYPLPRGCATTTLLRHLQRRRRRLRAAGAITQAVPRGQRRCRREKKSEMRGSQQPSAKISSDGKRGALATQRRTLRAGARDPRSRARHLTLSARARQSRKARARHRERGR